MPVSSGSPLVPDLSGYTSKQGTYNGVLNVTVNAATLDWTNMNGYGKSNGGPEFFDNGGSAHTIVFPSANNTGSYTFGLSESAGAYAGNITLSDGGCAGVTGSYSPSLNSPSPYQPLAGTGVTITMASGAASPGNCTITASDGSGRSTTLTIYVTQTGLTISNKARTNR